MAKWRVEYADGGFDVTKDTRAISYGNDDIESAIRSIKKDRRFKKGDTIQAYDKNGIRLLVRQ